MLKQDDFYELVCIQKGNKTVKIMESNDPLISDALLFAAENMEKFCRPKKSLLSYDYPRPLNAVETESILRNTILLLKIKY